MSYVIQNFYFNEKKIVFNLRIKYFLIFHNLNFIFLLFKFRCINLYFYFLNYKSTFQYLNYPKHFSNLIKFFYRNNKLVPLNYANNWYSSLIYWNLKLLHDQLIQSSQTRQQEPHVFISSPNYYLFYLKPIKIVNFEINKNFYDKVIFLNFLLNHQWWPAHDKNFNFLYSYLIIQNFFKINNFYNNIFFTIYNI